MELWNMEQWNNGTSEQWNSGTTEQWNMEHWNMEQRNKQLSTENEEKVAVNIDRHSFDEDGKSDADVSEEGAITDLFVSLPPLKGVPREENPLTVRAVLVGIILGSLCNASNVYLGSFLPLDINSPSKHVLTPPCKQVLKPASPSLRPCLVQFLATVSSFSLRRLFQ